MSVLRGVFFDFSGTIVHTESLYHAVMLDVLAASSVIPTPIDPDELRAHSGLSFHDRFTHMLAMRGIDDDELVEQLSKQAEQSFEKTYSTQGALVPGIQHLIHQLHTQNITLAVVSSAGHSYIEQQLQKAGMLDAITLIVGGDDVSFTKPHPAPYMSALEQLRLKPEQVVAFEDTPPGIESAVLAGLTVVGLLTTFERDDLHKAARTIQDYTEIQPVDIERLLA